jgi:hypothetical protein
MWYCKKVNRECLYYEKCNSNSSFIKLNEMNNIFFRFNIEKILLKIWIKKVLKIEQVKISELEKIISLYKNEYHYWLYSFNDQQYFIKNQNDERKNMFYFR